MSDEIKETEIPRLTDQQEKAKNLILSWFNSVRNDPIALKNKPIFVFEAYAGCGKTFLINYLVKYGFSINYSDIVFICPTAKAAMVLISGGCDAQTLHRFLYNCKVKNNMVLVNGNYKIVQEIKFIRKKFTKNNRPKLIILDEASMASEDMINDLLTVKSPILMVGDAGQLPPVGCAQNHYMKEPDIFITEIIRQAAGNPIINISKEMREGKYVPAGDYRNEFGEVKIIDRNTLNYDDYVKILLGADQIICGKNETKNKINFLVRQKFGAEGLCDDGDKIICTQNSYAHQVCGKYILANGMQGIVRNFKIVDESLGICELDFLPDFAEDKEENWLNGLYCELAPFLGKEYRYLPRSMVYVGFDGKYSVGEIIKKKPGETKEEYKKRLIPEIIKKRNAVISTDLLRFEFAYCITTHKSQGDTYNNIVVIDESKIFGDMKNKWLYVAITRARDSVVLLR